MEENKTPGSGKFDPNALIEEMKTVALVMHDQSRRLTAGIGEMDKKIQEAQRLIDEKLQEVQEKVSDMRIGISEEDVKKLDSYKDYVKHYKPILYISALTIVSSWVLCIFSGYSSTKWFRESVRTKEEVRTSVLQEISNDGNVIVEKQKWEEYKEQAAVVKAWQTSNPKDGESLINYVKGYEEFKKKGK